MRGFFIAFEGADGCGKLPVDARGTKAETLKIIKQNIMPVLKNAGVI